MGIGFIKSSQTGRLSKNKHLPLSKFAGFLNLSGAKRCIASEEMEALI